MQATIIFPHQLFKNHPAVKAGLPVFLVEEDLFFKQYYFHKQKLVLHRASMKAYESFLRKEKIPVEYVDAQSGLSDIRKLIAHLAKKGLREIHFVEVTDNWLNRRFQKECSLHGLILIEYPSPNFLNTPAGSSAFFDKKKTYFQTDFYIQQRKERNILIESHGQPLGSKWTYDTENRKRFPKKEIIPVPEIPKENKYVKEARAYVTQHFKNNYGFVNDTFKEREGFYPVTFEETDAWLNNFLKHRFNKFGIYEDAILSKESFLYHSVLTPMLNIGLINPQQVIDKAMDAAIEYAVPLNSLEGFIRQIIGWREFIRIVYDREGSKQRTTNFWGFTRKIPPSFWSGTTGIAPIDIVIKKVLQTGYAHHIERLMVLGNFMLLCGFHPNEVYKWFMEMFVDSYDWVMVPNVYGMAQFADGGLMTTKPYISGSNYLMKMGDFEKGPWQQTWDGLFWRFMHTQRDFFLKNPRLGMLVHTFDKMSKEKQQTHLQNAENYLKNLDEKDNSTKK
jgi:deoxyribodipyrimidine photolyase-related protein